MGNPRIKGLVYLLGFLAVAGFFCGFLPFVVMPGGGTGVALPVIEVPGEVVSANSFFGMNLTNSIIGTIVTNVLVLLIVFVLWRMTKGWTRKVPSRLQLLFEEFISAFRGFLRGIGGDKLDNTPFLWPLVATIFFFLLTANYMKLLPGVETVGYMHCAYAGQSGFPMIQGANTPMGNSYRLWVDEPLNAGTSQTAETEELCLNYYKKGYIPKDGFPVEMAAEIEDTAAQFSVLLDQLPKTVELEERALADAREAEGEAFAELEQEEIDELVAERLQELEDERAEAYLALVEGYEADAEGAETGELGEIATERLAVVAGTTYDDAYNYVRYADQRIESATIVESLQPRFEAINALTEALDADDDEEGISETRESAAEDVLASIRSAADDTRDPVTTADLVAQLEAAEVAALEAETEEQLVEALEAELDAQQELLNQAQTQLRYPDATIIFNEDQLETDARPYIFHITPFVRGPATDLSFTFGLAILAIFIVQIYGVRALGPAYFEKFINLSALGNVGKRPLGVIDFVVGLIEIISEIGKIVSLAFRLFGNLFAGGVALMAMTFLVALFVPGVIYGLELIIGAVQALVFAVLTLVFSVQAMEHHGDHDHDDHGHHEEAH